jgi:hypothetical protein
MELTGKLLLNLGQNFFVFKSAMASIPSPPLPSLRGSGGVTPGKFLKIRMLVRAFSCTLSMREPAG